MPNLKTSLIIITCFLFFLSCKKETPAPKTTPVNNGQPDSTRDFMFIPMKDARWKTRYYGTYVSKGNGEYYFDTTQKFLIITEPTGTDTFVDGKHYYLFIEDASAGRYVGKHYFYLREDTSDSKVYITGSGFNEKLLLNYGIGIGDKVGKSSITAIDSFLMNGKYLKQWFGTNGFRQAIGAGTSFGLYSGNDPADGARYQGTTFFYKEDSIIVY